MTQPQPKKSDLSTRVASAVVMVAVAGTALWLGGGIWAVFVALVAVGVLWEWRGLVHGFQPFSLKRGLWNAAGVIYVGLAAFMLVRLRTDNEGSFWVVLVVASVIATDVSAYFSGRTFGGPKIAPKISPSKTWAGLVGGTLGAGLTMFALFYCYNEVPFSLAQVRDDNPG